MIEGATTDRRSALKLAVAGMAAGALPAGSHAAKPGTLIIRRPGRDYHAALNKLRAYAAAELDAVGQQGMTLAIADADGFAATLTVGWANVEAKVPVTPDHWFEIGSISKSITALCLHSLADEGKIDLDSPISRYVETSSLPPKPITLQQLLNHAGGLAHDAPLFPANPDGRLWSGFEPGSRFSYSNIGYRLLGLAIARVAGRPHPEVIRDRVLRPLGMTDAAAHLLVADRAKFATGYVPLVEDRPILLRPAMIAGPFDESDEASGAVGASGSAMLAYLHYVMTLGRGHGGPLFSDARAKTLLARDIENDEFGPKSRYASGFATVSIDKRSALHHTGGMILFTSSFHVDPAAGVGCFASVNGRIGSYRPRKTTAYAVQLMRAVAEGKPLPDAPDPTAYRKVTKPDPWLGRWTGSDGQTIEFAAAPMGLKLIAEGKSARIETGGKNAVITDHPAYSQRPFQLEMTRGAPAQLWWGSLLFGRGAAPGHPKPDPVLSAYAGVYSDGAPWNRSDVIVRGNKLYAEGLGEIVKQDSGFWSEREDSGGVTRLWFDRIVNGQPFQLSFCGEPLSRLS